MRPMSRKLAIVAALLAGLGAAVPARSQGAAPDSAASTASAAAGVEKTDVLIRQFVSSLVAEGPQKPTSPEERFQWAEKAVERAATGLFKQGLFPELRSMICILYESRPDVTPPKKDCSAPDIAATLHYLRASSMLSEFEFNSSTDAVLDTPAQIYGEREKLLSAARYAIDRALDALFEQRRKIDADRFRGLRAKLLVQRARNEMYWADLGYRLLGASMVTELFADSQAPNVSARYGSARQYLFEGIILDPKNVEAKLLGEEIETRLRWLKEKRAFGGLRFFEVEPVMGAQDGAQWTPLARLEQIGKRLDAIQNEKRRVGEARNDFAKTLDAFRDEILQAQKQRQARLDTLSAAIADVQYKIGLQKESGRQFLSAQTERIQRNLAESESTRRELELRRAAVEQEVQETLAKLEAVVNELGRVSQRKELEETGLGVAALSVKEVFNRVGKLIDELQKTATGARGIQVQTLAAAWSELQQSAGTSLGQLKAEEKRLKLVKDRVLKLRDELDTNLKELRVDQLEAMGRAEADAIKLEMNGLEQQAAKATQGVAGEVSAFKQKILDLVQNSIKQAQDNVKREIENVRSKIEKAKQLVDLVKQNNKRFEEVITSANAAIQAAGAMQSGVIAGTANGVFTNIPQALMKVQELGVKLVEFQRLAMNDIRQAEDTINDLKSTVERYQAELDSLGSEGKKAEINQAIEQVQARAASEAGAIRARLIASVQQLQANAEAAKGRIEERFANQTQALLARKAAYEAEANAILAEIAGNTEKIEAEKRRARELARRVAVLEQELGTRKGELDGISKAIEEASARSAAMRDRVNQDTQEHQALLDDVQRELAARLRVLEEEARQLVAGGPEGAGVAPIPNLASATIGLRVDAIAREEIALMDEANRLTFQFANWLYLLSREPRALEWAVSVQTAAELNIVRQRLNQINGDVQATIGLTVPRFFGVRLTRDDLNPTVGNEATSRIVFTVTPSLNGFPSKSQTVSANDREYVGEESYSMYSPIPAFRPGADQPGINRRWDKYTSELIFAPFVETERKALSLLWDVWVVPRWKTAPAPELSIIGLRPVGPTEYFVSGSIDSQPVLRPREPNFSSTTFSYDRIRAQYRAATARIIAGDSHKSLIDGTLPGMNYRSVLGRGLGNTWELILPRKWSSAKNATPALEELEGVDIIFGYLVAPERGRSVTAAPDSPVTTQLDGGELPLPPEDTWLNKQCGDAYDRLLCAIASYRRGVEREARFKTSETSPTADPDSLPYAFRNSPSGRAGRARILELWHVALPTTGELARDDVALDRKKFVGCFAAAHGPQNQPAANGCPGADLLTADLFADRKAAGEALGLRVAKMTNKVVREEMLALPQEPSPVGPIELLRIFRSIETLVGSVKATSAQGDKPRPTLLSEIEALAVRLQQLRGLLDGVAKNIKGPIAVVRRLVDDYETSRMQLQFARDLADALRNGALLRDSDAAGVRNLSASAKRLIEIVRATQSHECAESWLAAASANPATKSVADKALEHLRIRQYKTLEQAYEADFDYLVADDAAAGKPLTLESFPIPPCAGPLTDALRLNTGR
jgi:hypothetical protein